MVPSQPVLHESYRPLVNVLVSDSPEEAQDARGRGNDVGPGGTRGVQAPAHLGHLARLATEEEGNGSDPEPLHLAGMVTITQFCCVDFSTIKNWCIKVHLEQMHNQGLHQLFSLMVFWDLHA